jgi:uncharacterized protein (TIGR02147 family)
MVFTYSDYRVFLKDELAARISSNARYSLRSFAKQMNIPASTLSELLSRKKQMTMGLVTKIVDGLKMSEHEATYLRLLVQLESESNENKKAELRRRAAQYSSVTQTQSLNLDMFRVIADWYCVVILESLELINLSEKQLVKQLGISRFEFKLAIERLEKLELIQKNAQGQYQKTKSDLLAESDIPNSALRKFHQQMLQKAIVAVEEQTPKEKVIGSETLIISKSQVKEAGKIIEECFQKISLLSKKTRSKEAVYHLGIQFFKLVENDKGETL